MNPKDKDLLLQHILDGQDEPETLKLLEHDQEAQAEAQFLAQLSQDLQRLRHVPECQLSTERLRDAILASEMRTRQKRGIWLWGYLPLGFAAAAACLIVLFNQKQPTSSTHVQASSPAINAGPDSTSPDEELDWVFAPQPEPAPVPAAKIATSEPALVTRRSGKSSRSRRTTVVANLSKPGSMLAMFGSLSAQITPGSGDANKKSVPTVVEAKDSEEPSSPEVVVVNNKESGSSGAPVAKEESSSKNIVCRG